MIRQHVLETQTGLDAEVLLCGALHSSLCGCTLVLSPDLLIILMSAHLVEVWNGPQLRHEGSSDMVHLALVKYSVSAPAGVGADIGYP